MMTWQEAFRLVLDHALPLGPEIGPVCSSSEGAILAETILADVDAPPFDKALMDGFALAGDTPAFPEVGPWNKAFCRRCRPRSTLLRSCLSRCHRRKNPQWGGSGCTF